MCVLDWGNVCCCRCCCRTRRCCGEGHDDCVRGASRLGSNRQRHLFDSTESAGHTSGQRLRRGLLTETVTLKTSCPASLTKPLPVACSAAVGSSASAPYALSSKSRIPAVHNESEPGKGPAVDRSACTHLCIAWSRPPQMSARSCSLRPGAWRGIRCLYAHARGTRQELRP